VREDQSLAQMANEVLMRQAKVRAERSGEPIEEAMEAVLNTEAGKQLKELRDGPHSEESVAQVQGRGAGASQGAGRRSRQASGGGL
jgi:hypothetical protein